MTPQSDHDLDRILHALATAEPAPGMEARIHARLQARLQARLADAGPEPAKRTWPWWGAGLSTATVVLAAACVLIDHGPTPGKEAGAPPSVQPAGNAPIVHASASGDEAAGPLFGSSAVPGWSAAPGSPAAGDHAFAPLVVIPGGNLRFGPPQSLGASAIEPQAAVPPQPPSRGLADLPSQLAPPAPLTAQERRLVQLARAPDPQSLAILDPVERELVAQQRAAEFTNFFPPPTNQVVYLRRVLLAQQHALNFIPPPTDQEIHFAEQTQD